MTVSFFVRGVPVPKGSMRAFAKGGRAWMTAGNAKTLKSWQDAVTFSLQSEWDGPPLDGPVRVVLSFVLLKPPSIPKKRTYPIVKPDIDKLVRSVLDALTGVAFRDDAQVCDLTATKMYGDESGVNVLVMGVQLAGSREAVA